MRVTLDVDDGDPPSLMVGTPERLFDWRYFAQPTPFRYHDISPDGQRFLMIRRPSTADAGAERTEINVIQNWLEELKRLVPVD